MRIFVENNLTEEFKYFLEKDYDIDLNSYLLELLSKSEPIKLDSEYLNAYYNRDDITEDEVWQYKDDEVFKEMKSDMTEWANEIQDIIKDIPGVEDVQIVGSNQAGMSTYINVNFKRPDKTDKIAAAKLKEDPKFLNHYFSGFGQGGGYDGEYRLKFRISNHPEKHISNTNVFMNITGHKFDWIRDNIVNLCAKRVNMLQNYWRDYCNTGKISPKQIERNKRRKNQEFLHLEYLNRGYIREKYMTLLKETFGGDRLRTMLDTNTLSYIDTTDVKLEDIVANVETHFQSSSIDYITLLFILADCLNKFILDYTFDTGFNYDHLYEDMEPMVDKYEIK